MEALPLLVVKVVPALGKDVIALNADGMIERYRFLPGADIQPLDFPSVRADETRLERVATRRRHREHGRRAKTLLFGAVRTGNLGVLRVSARIAGVPEVRGRR